MEKEVLIYADLSGTSRLVGRLWSRWRKNRESATFEYDKQWHAHPEAYALEPALHLGPGPFHTALDKPLFGAIADSAPDRWGRELMRRAERRRAEQAGETPRTLNEIDYLLGVDDQARQGALRFSAHEGGPFLAERGAAIPPLVELPRLLSAAENVLSHSDTDDDLRLLLAPGSSLGGARPKASVRDKDGQLAIAKFPSQFDTTNVVRWEALALSLAAKAGIAVPAWRVQAVGGKSVLLLRRFDRQGAIRLPFLSALSMLQAHDNEPRSYLEIADALRRYGAAPKVDLQALWKRIVFNILISNTDDHLRNHGFLYEGTAGWRLAPSYDLNPTPSDIKPRILSTAIDMDDGTASLELALQVASYFHLELDQARLVAGHVGKIVAGWRQEAAALELTIHEINRMASAFEHADLKAAAAFG